MPAHGVSAASGTVPQSAQPYRLSAGRKSTLPSQVGLVSSPGERLSGSAYACGGDGLVAFLTPWQTQAFCVAGIAAMLLEHAMQGGPLGVLLYEEDAEPAGGCCPTWPASR